jgi:putative ABC transport system permease protein
VSGFKVVGHSYFDTVGMRLLKGRSLEEGDIAGAVPVTVINDTMAKTYFKGEDPIGKRILIRELVFGKSARGPEIPWQIVGVVTDERSVEKSLQPFRSSTSRSIKVPASAIA